MKFERVWTKWTYWAFGVHQYATTVSRNAQLAVGPFRFEFAKILEDTVPSISFGQMRREASGAWQGKKKMEKIYGRIDA